MSSHHRSPRLSSSSPDMAGVETAESAEFFWTCSQVKRGEPRLQGAFKAGEKLQTKHWSCCPLTHMLPQADHGHGPAEVHRAAALHWGWRGMGSPCPNGIYCFFREGITSSSWHQFPESIWATKLVVTPILHPFQDSESVSQVLLSPKNFLNAFMMLVIPSSCFFPQEKRGLGLIKLCCQLGGSESWFALEHHISRCSHDSMMLPDLCKTKSGLCFFRKQTSISPPLPFAPYTTAQRNTTFQIPRTHKNKKNCNYPCTHHLGTDFWLRA